MTPASEWTEITVRRLPFEHADSTLLHSAQRAEIASVYGSDDLEPGDPATADNMNTFVVAYTDGMPSGCGGLRNLGESESEIKRMYVTPAHRGSGVSRAVLAELELIAREQGTARLVLETGDRLPAAQRFYEREGFNRIDNFGPYAGVESSICYAKAL